MAGSAAAVGALAAVFAVLFGPAVPSRPNEIMLIYIGADDCPPCRTWQREAEVKITTSPAFARLSYRPVKAPALFDLLNDSYWPVDLRTYRDQLGPGSGVPSWLVVADGKLLVQAAGISQWNKVVLPRLEALLR